MIDLNFEPTPPVEGIRGAAGLGKSEAVLDALAGPEMRGKFINYYVPEHRLSSELATRFAAKTGPDGPRALVIRGRSQALDDGTPMCRKFLLAEGIAQLGHSVPDKLCLRRNKGDQPDEKCEYYDGCLHVAQMRNKDPAVRFLPHAYLFLDDGLPQAEINVIDERFWPAALRGTDRPVFIGLHRLTATRLPGRRATSATRIADLLAIAHKAAGVFAENAAPGPAAFRAAGLTASDCAFAKGIEYSLVEELRITPGMAEPTQWDRLEQYRLNEALRLGRFWSLLEQEIELDRPELRSIRLVRNAVTAEGGLEDRIYMRWRADFKISAAPTLVIDADLDPLIARRFLPTMADPVGIEAERRNNKVTQITDRPVSKQMLTFDLEGSVELQERRRAQNPQECQRTASRRAELRTVIEVEAAAGPARDGLRVLCVTYDAVERALLRGGEINGADIAHFNAIRGRDGWRDVAVLIVAGRPQLSVEDLEEITAALFFDDPRPITFIKADAKGRRVFPVERRGYRGAAGSALVEYHPDPLCAAVLYQIRESELVQAIDRARLIHRGADNPCIVLILTNVVLPVTVHRLSTWDEVVPDRFVRALWRGPAMPVSDAELARCYPDLWQSPGAVEQDRRRTENPYKSLLELLIGKRRDLIPAEYRRKGQRGKATPALVSATAPDARAAIESVVGPVDRFRLVGPNIEAAIATELGKVTEPPACADPVPPSVPPRVTQCGTVAPPIFALDQFFGARTRPVAPIVVPHGVRFVRRTAVVAYAHPPLDETPPQPPPQRNAPIWLVRDGDALDEQPADALSSDAPPVDAAPSLPSYDATFLDGDLDPSFEPDRLEATRRWLALAREGQHGAESLDHASRRRAQ